MQWFPYYSYVHTCSMSDGVVVIKVLPRLRTPCDDSIMQCKGLQLYHTVTIPQ